MRCKRRLVVAALGCLAAAAFVLNTVHFQGSLSRADVTLQPTTVAEQEPTQDAIEAAALAEAIAAPRIGPDGEDRSAPAPREASGAGRRDDTHVRPAPALPPELPSDPELPEEDEFSVSPTGAGGGGTPVSTPTLCPRRLPAALSHVLCHTHQPVPGFPVAGGGGSEGC